MDIIVVNGIEFDELSIMKLCSLIVDVDSLDEAVENIYNMTEEERLAILIDVAKGSY